MKKISIALFLCGLLGVQGLGCSKHSDELELLDSKETESAELLRKQQMQVVRLADSNGDIWEMDPDFLSTSLAESDQCSVLGKDKLCWSFSPVWGFKQRPCSCDRAATACEEVACEIRENACVSEALLKAAEPTGELVFTSEIFIEGKFVPGTFRVLPPNAATRAGLAYEAMRYSSRAVTLSGELLGPGITTFYDACFPGQPDCDRSASELPPSSYSGPRAAGATGTCSFSNTHSVNGHSLNSYAAAMLREGQIIGHEAANLAFESNLAVSDAELGSSVVSELAQSRSVSGGLLSRAAAAHLIAGGKQGIEGNSDSPLCTEELTAQGESALAIFRKSGVSPVDVQNSAISTSTLVNGTSGTTYGTVRQRLSFFDGQTSAQSLWDFFGLKLTDFEAARRKLSEEIRAFARSSKATLPDLGGDFKVFAATATEPHSPPSPYFLALAQTDRPFGGTYSPVGGTEWQSVSDFIDNGGNVVKPPVKPPWYADSWSEFALYDSAWTRYLTGLRGATLKELGPISDQVSSDTQVEGTLLHCSWDPSSQAADGTDELFINLLTESIAPTRLWLLKGEDALRCAETGSVEGQPCLLTEADFLVSGPPISVTTHPGFVATVKFSLPVAQMAAQRAYLVTSDKSIPGPGEYRSLAGYTPYRYAALGAKTGGKCRNVPFGPELRTKVANALEPAPRRCTRSRVSCAGAEFDERLPLENELSSDGDGVESSWKHFLSLARTAADKADSLASAYLDSSVSLDAATSSQEEKAAAALEELQALCGTSVNVTVLLDALTKGTGNIKLADLGTCTGSSDAGAGNTCVGGRKIANWDKIMRSNAELAPLADCIENSNLTVPYVHLGNATMCAWTGNLIGPDGKTIQTGILCGNQIDVDGQKYDVSRFGCPYVASGDVCTVPDGIPSTVPLTVIKKEDGLSFFDTKATMPPPRSPTTCDNIRKLRQKPGNQDLIAQIVNSGVFDKARVEQAARSLSLAVEYGDYYKLRVSGDVRINTGDYVSGTVSGWPCGPNQGLACKDKTQTQKSFLCASAACGDADSYTNYTHRLIRAVATAQHIAGQPLNVRLAAYLNDVFDVPDSPRANMVVSRVRSRTGGDASDNPRTIAKASGPGGDIFIGPLSGPLSTWHSGTLDIAPTKEYDFTDCGNGGICDHLSFTWTTDATPNPVGKRSYRPAILPYMVFGRDANDSPHYARHRLAVEPLDYGIVFGNASNNGLGEGAVSLLFRGVNGPIQPLRIGATIFEPSHADFVVPSDEFEKQHGFEQTGAWDFYNYIGAPIFDTVLELSFKEDQLWDAVELLCEASAGDWGGGGCSLANPPVIRGPEDLSQAGQYLQCAGDKITYAAATTILPNFPSQAKEVMELGTVLDATPGDLAQAYSDLRVALQEIAKAQPAVGSTVRGMGSALKDLSGDFVRFQLEEDKNQIQFEAEQLQQMTSCITAMSNVGSGSPWSVGAQAAGATASCANSGAQIAFASRLKDIGNKENSIQREQAVTDFNRRFDDTSVALQQQQWDLAEGFERAAKAISVIETKKKEAGRALNKALWYLSGEAGAVISYRATKNLAKERYVRAHKNAQKMAFLAKRAIEERLAVSLSDIRDDLPLVDAPQGWESTVCETSPVDFDALKSASQEDTGKFADQFIGDYVTKLENVVESYQLEYNFQNGSDVAVVSLRDDVVKSRSECQILAPNLLAEAGQLAPLTQGATANGWSVQGCSDNSAGQQPYCASSLILSSITGSSTTPFSSVSPYASTAGYRLTFGDGAGCTDAEKCTWNNAVSVGQDVSVSPGRYRFSWYAPVGSDGLNAGKVWFNGSPMTVVDSGTIAGDAFTWSRRFLVVEVASAGVLRVGFVGNGAAISGGPVVAAPMLTSIEPSSSEPGPFVNTDASRLVTVPACPDSDGNVFRSAWRRGCELLCEDGFGGNCAGNAKQACYWELDFHMTQRAIEAGEQFSAAGFAKGNYNYRIQRVGLNFVGTGLRDCSTSSTPEACYGSGNLPFSLYHLGPQLVRNHFGEEYKAHLFDGHIEHGRGLASERYLSNPISSSDRDLLSTYMRQEFNGRPLDGTFVLRVWDEPGVKFEALKDVQLDIEYGYWTRND